MTAELLTKLLSHRLRGYAKREHAYAALHSLSLYPVSLIEVDTRASADGTLFLSHTPYARDRSGRRRRIAEMPDSEIAIDGPAGTEPGGLVALDQALEQFARHAARHQTLCLDIKDVGFERHHLTMIRRYDLEDRTILISWAPQVIRALASIETRCPLFLSYLDLSAFGWLGRLAAKLLASSMVPLGRFVVLGRDRADGDLGRYQRGYQHALVSCGLDASLSESLRASGGGVCLPTRLASPGTLRRCREQGLRTAVFNTYDSDDFQRWAALRDVDIVFSDNAPGVYKDLTGWNVDPM